MMECVHRWRLSEPNGPLADAVCRYCGAARAMPNGDHTGEKGLNPMSPSARAGWALAKARERANRVGREVSDQLD